ncbi:MAG: manganese transporter [Proteobacteria bacterium]|nr:MAG: manganese transporter [Pseudomonadota bacterium]
MKNTLSKALLAPLALAPIVLAAALGGAGCSQDARARKTAAGQSARSSISATGKLRVVATTGMVADLARRVAGEHATVEALMGPGVDPHLYKPTAGDVGKLSRADLVLYNGLHLEGKMGQIFARLARRRPVVAIAAKLPKARLLSPPEYPGAHDPHVWFDAELWSRTVARVVEALAEQRPASRAAFARNGEAYRGELLALDRWVVEQLAAIPKRRRVLVTAHDAFGYFGKRYAVEVVGLQGISTTSKASLKDIKRVADVIVARKVPAIFVESSVPRRTVEAVQAACASRGQAVRIGGELYSDALGPRGSGAETYLTMVRHNVRQIVEALR